MRPKTSRRVCRLGANAEAMINAVAVFAPKANMEGAVSVVTIFMGRAGPLRDSAAGGSRAWKGESPCAMSLCGAPAQNSNLLRREPGAGLRPSAASAELVAFLGFWCLI